MQILPINPLRASRAITLEGMVAWIVALFVSLFAVWTIAHHAATFFRIPWIYLSQAFFYASLPLFIAAGWAARYFSRWYIREVHNNPPLPGPIGLPTLLVLITVSAWVLATSAYMTKFLGAAAGLVLVWALSRNRQHELPSHAHAGSDINPAHGLLEFVCLSLLVAIAVIITLTANRPDLDDASFLQIAAQTLRHPMRPPLTFDSSLGYATEPFRFAPYRLASYETAVALISQWSGLSLLSVYYVLLPGVTAVLTICVGYLFLRWFVPAGWAIVGTAVFLILIMCWGESHFAYGNRVLVRLFQGKGLLIAVTTPAAILTGLMLLRRPSFARAIPLVLSNIAAIGVSSSGVVLTILTSTLLALAGTSRDSKQTCSRYLWIGVTFLYPAVLVYWLKFRATAGMSLNEVGTYLPVDASLGKGLRESSALVAMVLGFAALKAGRQRLEYRFLILGTFVLILNPWFADFLARNSSANMSWRLAWASPVPLLISIGLVAATGHLGTGVVSRRRIPSIGLALLGIGLFGIFASFGQWSISPENNVKFGMPGPKLPGEYRATRALADKLRSLNLRGAVLAPPDVAAWLPLVAPELKLIMPGHTYPIMLQTILPRSEYEARMKMYSAMNSQTPDFTSLAALLSEYRVEAIVADSRLAVETIASARDAGSAADFVVREIPAIEGYEIFKIDYASHD